MRKFIDITGQRFGILTAVRATKKRADDGNIIWECYCGCGKKWFVRGSYLRNGHTKSCGCLFKKIVICGERFERLVAIRPTKKRAGTSVVWECQCDCGKICFVKSGALRRGHTKSCGCFKIEAIKKRQRIHPEAAYLIPENKRYTKLLTNSYVTSKLRAKGLDKTDITQELIDIQRSKIKLHRAVVKTKEVLNEFL